MSLHRRLLSHGIGADDPDARGRVTSSLARLDVGSRRVAMRSTAHGGEPG
jgi:hypothetical protein